MNIFELLYPTYKITKPIRLIELFAGIGSQAKALENIGANFETYKVVEFDPHAIKSYNAIHGTNFEPLDITKIHARDLDVRERERYEYIMTYSFPCQDLSLAGKTKGMTKGTGTRSGLLWEVERLLNESDELPQILLMENVPQVIGTKNIDDFKEWYHFLENKGYSNYFEILNAKNYGIPQNRSRCFMVSILGEYYYEFPHKIPLTLKLKDMLEAEVDEKYFLSDKMIKYVMARGTRGYQREPQLNNEIARTINTTPTSHRSGIDNYLTIKNATQKGYLEAKEGDRVDISTRMESHRGTVQKDMAQTLDTQCHQGVVVKKYELCDKLIQENKVEAYDIVRHSYSQSRMNNPYTQNENNISSTLDTRSDCLGVVIPTNETLQIRKLTPKECWRLMGFSDEAFEKAEKVNSNAQLYKQAGNSIVVNVLEAIFKQLL